MSVVPGAARAVRNVGEITGREPVCNVGAIVGLPPNQPIGTECLTLNENAYFVLKDQLYSARQCDVPAGRGGSRAVGRWFDLIRDDVHWAAK